MTLKPFGPVLVLDDLKNPVRATVGTFTSPDTGMTLTAYALDGVTPVTVATSPQGVTGQWMVDVGAAGYVLAQFGSLTLALDPLGSDTGGGAVDSVNGLTGAVVLDAAAVGAVPTSRTVNGKALSADITLTNTDVGAAATSHTHAAGDVTSGTLAVARLGTGTPAAGTYVDGATGAWTPLPAGGGGSSVPLAASVAHLADQTTTTDTGGGGVWSPLAPSGATSVASATVGDTARVAANVLALPACTLVDIAVNIVTAGAAGSTVRLGIWATDAKGKPGAILWDSGALAADSTGWKTAAGVNLALAAGVYWVGIAQSDAAIRYAGWEQALRVALGPNSGFDRWRSGAGTWAGAALPSPLVIGRTNGSTVAAPILYAKANLT